jgi:prefoldin subunit 5
MVQGRYRMISYKVHIQEKVPEEDWIIVENTHEAIIDRSTFEKVQGLLKRDTRTGPQQNKLYLFSGFLRCADCGKAMTRSEVKGTVYYYCRTYKDQSKAACTKHTIRHNRMEAAVLYAVQQQVFMAVHYTNTIASINKAPLMKSQSDKIRAAIEQKEKELAKVTRYKQAVWQDWKDGELSHMDYRHLKEDYEAQAHELMQIVETLRAEQAGLEKGIDVENPFLSTFRQYKNIDKLTREVLVELVEQIKVYDNGNISVKFKFSDESRRRCEYIDMNTQLVAV